VAPSCATLTPSVSSINGNENTNGSGTTRSGGTTKGGGARAYTSMQDPLFAFNQVMELFCELR